MIKTKVMRKVYLAYKEEELATFWGRPDEKTRLQSILRKLGITTHTIVGKRKLIIHINIENYE